MTTPGWFIDLYQAAMISALILSIPSVLMYSNRWTNRVAVLIFGVVAVTWISRYAITGHFPMFGAYESALSLAFFSGTILLPASKLHQQSYLSFYPSIVAALLYHGKRYSSTIYALTISERGFWVHLHAIVAFVCFGLAVLLFLASVLVLLGNNAPIKKLLLFFYLLYTLTIITGSFYEFLLFGRVWSFDPIETMNLACFLGFTTLAHMISFQNWAPRRIASWSIFCSLLLVAAYRLILIFPPETTYHIFDIDLRIHLVR